MTFKSGRGGWRGGGRPKGSAIPEHLKRIKMNDFRIPQWLVGWLKSQPESGSRLIERALITQYKIEPPHDYRNSSQARREPKRTTLVPAGGKTKGRK